MNNSVFEIENLNCAYKGSEKEVLQIESLSIPDKTIVAILGLSGVGKSTLLETLGLMNNTLRINEKTRFIFRPEPEKEIDLREIWKHGDKEISYIRNRYFSFIFQDTNLMPNFSVYENICLTLMLQGHSMNQAEAITDDYLKKIGLDEVENHQKIYELSGGQRQRVAFLRAISPSFKVIFADEPTGNLDKFTAGVLMELLHRNIKEQQSTAVIVSHDVDLSIKFADQIILIHKLTNSINGRPYSYGQISNALVFTRSLNNQTAWNKTNGEQIENNELNKLIRSHLANSNKL